VRSLRRGQGEIVDVVDVGVVLRARHVSLRWPLASSQAVGRERRAHPSCKFSCWETKEKLRVDPFSGLLAAGAGMVRASGTSIVWPLLVFMEEKGRESLRQA
jgi:hypothetical protein